MQHLLIRSLLASALAPLLLLASACSNSDTLSQAATATDVEPAPASGEQLYAIPPNGWSLSSSSNTGKFRRARYVRVPGAEVEETLTFEYLDPEGLPDPIAFLESMATEQSERCEEFSSSAIGSGVENGYPSAVRLLRCPRRNINRTAIVSLAKAIQGNDGYYLLVFEKRTKASRGADGWRTDHATEADMATWSLYLRQAIACDSRGNEHPCPGDEDLQAR